MKSRVQNARAFARLIVHKPTPHIIAKKQRTHDEAVVRIRFGRYLPALAWLPGCLAAWLSGCLAAWLPGCLAAWLGMRPLPAPNIIAITITIQTQMFFL